VFLFYDSTIIDFVSTQYFWNSIIGNSFSILAMLFFFREYPVLCFVVFRLLTKQKMSK